MVKVLYGIGIFFGSVACIEIFFVPPDIALLDFLVAAFCGLAGYGLDCYRKGV